MTHLEMINNSNNEQLPTFKVVKNKRLNSNVVSARDLHEFLGVGKDFSNWVKDRIEKFGFVENHDFVKVFFNKNNDIIQLTKNGEPDNQQVRPHKIEYAITSSMAKEIAMVENNEKGKLVRKYFIAIEEKHTQQHLIPRSFSDALFLAANQAKQLEEQEEQLQLAHTTIKRVEQQLDESKNIVDTFNKISESNDFFTIEQAAKNLAIKGLGRNNIFKLLRDNKVFNTKNLPYQRFVDAAFFKIVNKGTYVTHDNKEKNNLQTQVSIKGQNYINKLYNKQLEQDKIDADNKERVQKYLDSLNK